MSFAHNKIKIEIEDEFLHCFYAFDAHFLGLTGLNIEIQFIVFLQNRSIEQTVFLYSSYYIIIIIIAHTQYMLQYNATKGPLTTTIFLSDEFFVFYKFKC